MDRFGQSGKGEDIRFAICEVAAQVEYDSRGCFLHLEGKATVKPGFGGRAPHSAKLTLHHIRPLKRRAAYQIFQIYRGLTVSVHRPKPETSYRLRPNKSSS